MVNQTKNFRFNVSIAHFYEVYKFLRKFCESKINNKILIENLVKIMKLMIPFIPHLAHECLEMHKCKSTNVWPEISQKNLFEKINLAVQINGKTRDIINIKKNLDKKDIYKTIIDHSKAKKYIEDRKIIKTIFVKNKIINYIISE